MKNWNAPKLFNMNNDLNNLSEDEKTEKEIQNSAENEQENQQDATNDVVSESDNKVVETVPNVEDDDDDAWISLVRGEE